MVPVSVTTTTLPAATVNVAYSQQLAASGGSGTYNWTLTTPVTGFSLEQFRAAYWHTNKHDDAFSFEGESDGLHQ